MPLYVELQTVHTYDSRHLHFSRLGISISWALNFHHKASPKSVSSLLGSAVPRRRSRGRLLREQRGCGDALFRHALRLTLVALPSPTRPWVMQGVSRKRLSYVIVCQLYFCD